MPTFSDPPSADSQGMPPPPPGYTDMDEEVPPDTEDSSSSSDSVDLQGFKLRLEDYPLYREIERILNENGCSPNDPLRLFQQITVIYERNLRQLASQQIQLAMSQQQQIASLNDEISNAASAIDEHADKSEALRVTMSESQKQSESIVKVLADTLPYLEKCSSEMSKAAALIDSKSPKAVLYSYVGAGLAFCAGFVTCLLFTGH